MPRGWDIQESPTAFQIDFAMDVDRWVNDRMSWVIPLDLNGVQVPRAPGNQKVLKMIQPC